MEINKVIDKIFYKEYRFNLLIIEKQKMISFPNYRISLKKNHPSKTVSNFPSLHRLTKKRNGKQKQNEQRNELFTQKLLNRENTDDKIFCFTSGDSYIKRILIGKGWILSPSCQLENIKLKWITLPKISDYSNLKNCQFINHFKDSYKLTTKLGLYNLLSNPHNQTLTNQNGKNYLAVYPRSYDIASQFEAFSKDFKHTAVLNLMKKLMIHIQIQHEETLYKKYRKICQNQTKKDLGKLKQYIEKLLSIQNLIFQNNSVKKRNQNQRIMVNKNIFITILKYFWHNFQGSQLSNSKITLLLNYSKLTPPFKNFQVDYFNCKQSIGFLTHEAAILFFKIYDHCIANNSCFLNDGLKNIWIVKANESSRGRNIFMIDSIQQLQNYRSGGTRLIQKYMQNVWILNQHQINNQTPKNHPKVLKLLNRKFDIRFWVLVKSFLPLEAYIFKEGYLRLSSQKYKFDQGQISQMNIKTHLTNFAINYKNVCHSSNNNTEQQDDSYVLFSQLENFLKQQSLTSQKDQSLYQKIKSKILYILENASINWRQCEKDKNSFQLFGFDIILDQNIQPYVLQCNMSPACQQRGQLMSLVAQMGQGLLQLTGIISKQQNLTNQSQKHSKSKWEQFQTKINSSKTKSSIGLFKNTFNSQFKIQNGIDGLNLEVTGKKLNEKQLIISDLYLDFLDKIILLQRFFVQRYRNRSFQKKRSQKNSSDTRICLMVQQLSIFSRKSKHFWLKKFLKYTKRIIKHQLKKN